MKFSYRSRNETACFPKLIGFSRFSEFINLLVSSDPAAEHGSDESHSEVEEEHTIISPNRKLDPETDSPMVKINEPNYESGANFSSDDQLPLLAPKTEALLDSRDGVDMPGMPNVASAQVQLSRNWIRPRQLHRCSECETAINGPYGNLYRHEMEVHGKQRPFSCPHCEYRSGHSHHVDTHIKGVHLGLKRYFCYCRRGFLFPSQVRAHWRKSHGNIHKAGHFVVGEDGVPVMRPVNISNP